MTPHWTEREADLRDWLVSSNRVLIGCDYDGTLAPLVNRAEDACMPPAAFKALQRLQAHSRVVVSVISGRKLDDIQERIGIVGALYGGNHGLEMVGPRGHALAPGAENGLSKLGDALALLRESIPDVPGAWLEDKQLTASVHYRLADKALHSHVEALVRRAVPQDEGLVIREGKCIWEIRPQLDWHKGAALKWMLDECSLTDKEAMFIGDDVTDHDAFRCIANGWPVLVGDTGYSDARIRVCDPIDTSALLTWMADVLDKEP